MTAAGRSACLWLLATALLLAGSVQGTDIYVDCSGDVETGNGSAESPFALLSSAVAAMTSGSYVVRVSAGASCSGLANTFDIQIPSTVSSVRFTGDAEEPARLICDGEASEEGAVSFHFTGLQSFFWEYLDVSGCATLVRGTGASGSTLHLAYSAISSAAGDLLRLKDVANVELFECSFEDLSAYVLTAQASHSMQAAAMVTGCSFSSCAGGLFLNGFPTLHVAGSAFDNVSNCLLATAMTGDWTVLDTTFNECTAPGSGAAVNTVGLHGNATDATTVISSCEFNHCSADRGGAVYTSGGVLVINDSVFTSNEATVGGGVLVEAAKAFMTNVTFSKNSADDLGGCVYLNEASQLTVTNSTLSKNEAGRAGAAFGCNGPSNIVYNIEGDDADKTVVFDDNKPDQFVNACVKDFYDYDDDSWLAKHWPLLVVAVIGTVVVGAVLVAFVVFEASKCIKNRRARAVSEDGEEAGEAEDGVAVEYDFSQPAAVV
mmetsp:Transcript_1818/g.6489  ORF Transcript_1818/g.6489 Transcript_1818/m.6489 type:complete len:489 (-) Transcript_1818:46-1512(-)